MRRCALARLALAPVLAIVVLALLGRLRAQVAPGPPVRSMEVSLWAGQTENLRLRAAEPGRRYTIRMSLESHTGPSTDARVEVDLPVKRTLDPLNPSIETSAALPDENGIALRVTGGGEVGDRTRIRVEWQAEPESKMSRVTFISSPNQDKRPPGASVTAVVVHATVIPSLDATVDWFLLPASQVSAHYVVGKDGAIVQMVEDTARAWHAGVSALEGVRGVNAYSVGIEIVNLNDGKDPFTDAQYRAVASIIRHLREQYVIPDSRIVSHESVALPAGRKNDPRGFDFDRLYRLAAVENERG